jgi:hypothetical protein
LILTTQKNRPPVSGKKENFKTGVEHHETWGVTVVIK